MRMMSRCFTWFPNCLVLGEPNIYHDLGDFTRIGDFTWRVSDCEELVVVTHRGGMEEWGVFGMGYVMIKKEIYHIFMRMEVLFSGTHNTNQ